MSRFDELVAVLCPDGVPYVALGELATCNTGGQLNKSSMIDGGAHPAVNAQSVYASGTSASESQGFTSCMEAHCAWLVNAKHGAR